MKLEGKVAIVTAAGRGIGWGIALCLAEEGADVVVNALHKETAEKVADEVKALGRKSLAIEADATDGKKIAQLVQETINTFGKIDILVNNVGGHGEAYQARTSLRFVDVEEAEWDQDFAINLKSHVLMCRAVVPHFQKQQSGKIVNISSGAGYGFSRAGPGRLPEVMVYGVAKAADIRFTRALAAELAEDNINVNCVCPGSVWSPRWEWEMTRAIQRQLIPEAKGMTPREYFLRSGSGFSPLKRRQTAEDIGHAVAFLVSEDARNITGQSLNVNGGSFMQ